MCSAVRDGKIAWHQITILLWIRFAPYMHSFNIIIIYLCCSLATFTICHRFCYFSFPLPLVFWWYCDFCQAGCFLWLFLFSHFVEKMNCFCLLHPLSPTCYSSANIFICINLLYICLIFYLLSILSSSSTFRLTSLSLPHLKFVPFMTYRLWHEYHTMPLCLYVSPPLSLCAHHPSFLHPCPPPTVPPLSILSSQSLYPSDSRKCPSHSPTWHSAQGPEG